VHGFCRFDEEDVNGSFFVLLLFDYPAKVCRCEAGGIGSKIQMHEQYYPKKREAGREKIVLIC
jgi:hypothetical protein